MCGTLCRRNYYRQLHHLPGEINEEFLLRIGGPRYCFDCVAVDRKRARQADDERRNGQADDAPPHAPSHASPLSSPHDEEADDGKIDVRCMALERAIFFFAK
jgi:hypothetical protein